MYLDNSMNSFAHHQNFRSVEHILTPLERYIYTKEIKLVNFLRLLKCLERKDKIMTAHLNSLLKNAANN